MNAAERFVWGRGAVSVAEFALWWGRAKSWAYAEIGRGTLVKCGPGLITADSIVAWYSQFEKGVMPEQATTLRAVPVAAGKTSREIRRRDAAAPISSEGGAR